jgi:hypothetical protein
MRYRVASVHGQPHSNRVADITRHDVAARAPEPERTPPAQVVEDRHLMTILD